MEYRIKGEMREVVHHVELWLAQDGLGGPIELKARHSSWPESQSYHILRIYEDGSIRGSSNIDERLGFILDGFNRIILE